jgi:uncharacterized protein YbjT (DUF2867 family)
MICVTGAGGTLGSELVRQLAAAKARYRVAHFSKEKAEADRAKGVDATVIDYARPATLRPAFEGCDELFLLGPTTENQTQLEVAGVEAAKAAGVRHVVKQSVIGAEGEDYSFAKIHRPVEKALESSGLAWTFLRPNNFMQNVVTFLAPTIRAEGRIYSACGQARISHVDVRDIAAVALEALTEPGHAGKSYALTGPEPLTYDEVARLLSDALGRPIQHVVLSPEAMKEGMLGAGTPARVTDWLLDLERYFREGRASRVTGDVERVTGRKPRRFADSARDFAPQLRVE